MLQTALMLGGAAWFLSNRQVGLALGLVAGAALHAGLDALRRLVYARELKGPFRTVRGRSIEVDVPATWDARVDDAGLHVTDGEATLSIAWRDCADLEVVTTALLVAHANDRTAYDAEPCLVRLLGVDVRGRRAVFSGWEMTVAEAYAVPLPGGHGALLTVLAVRTEAVPEALLRRCVESIRAGGRGLVPQRQSDPKLEIHVRPSVDIHVRPRPPATAG